MHPKNFADYAAYLLLRLLLCVIQALPMEICHALSTGAGWLCWNVLRFRRAVVTENLRFAFPEKTLPQRDAIAAAMWEHLFLMIVEVAHAPRKVRRTTWRQYSSPPSMNEMLERLIDERPLIIISGHLGNFEMGGYLLALHGFPSHTVARKLDNPYLDRFLNRFRSATGQHIVPMKGSIEHVTKVMERGGTIVLLGDQHAGRGGYWVNFFGRPAATHKAVAVLTLSSRAPTAITVSLRHDRPLYFEMKVADIIDPVADDFEMRTVPELTEWYTQHLETLIRSHPEQYWWVHRRWKGSREARRKWRRNRRAQLAA